MSDRTRLLWHSNSPTAPTGYGIQTALFAERLNRDYEVAISAFYGLEGSPMKWKGIPLLPGLGGNFGAEYLPMHAARWGGDDPRNTLVMTLMDVWVLPPAMVLDNGPMKLICWTPVDHDPAPPKVKQFLGESGAIPLAMSRFGQEALSEFNALYCPHAIRADVYKPIPQKEAREITGVPEDIFLIGMVAANKGRPSRKGFQFAFEAFKDFRDRHENAYLFLHTSFKAEWMQGENLWALLDALEISHDAVVTGGSQGQYDIHFAPPSTAEMSMMYSSMDVLLNPCTGGGFEIAQLEAAACGVPTITTDFTAMPESAGPTPWKVGGRKFWTGQESWNLFAHVSEITDALEDCYSMKAGERKALAKELRAHGEAYDADRVYEEHMLPSIRKAEKRLHNRSVQFDFTEGLDVEEPKRELKSDGPSISVVTPWHEHPELAEAYWKALDGEKTHEVIVVDNGSELPVARVGIRLEENTGFCHANNVGFEKATGDAVLFVNNDIALGIPGWLEAIRAELEPGVIVGADMRADQHTQVDGQLQPYIDGWCIAVMKEDMEALGGWDEEYEEPAYYSDNDLCLRAKQAGMRFAAVSPPLIHLENKTAGPPVGKVVDVTRRNYRKFAQKVREAEAVPV